MKNLLLAFLLVSGGLLFTQCKDKATTNVTVTPPPAATDSMATTTNVITDTTDNVTATPRTATAVTGKIVYVNTDTLLEQYQYYKDLKKQLEAEAKKAESGFESKSKGYQNKVLSFQKRIQESQQKAPTMTENELKKLEEELKAQESALMQEEQSLLGQKQAAATKLADKETDLQKRLKKRIDNFLQKLCAEKGYDFVLTEGGIAGNILYGNKALDVTKEVVDGLNAEYRQKQ